MRVKEFLNYHSVSVNPQEITVPSNWFEGMMRQIPKKYVLTRLSTIEVLLL